MIILWILGAIAALIAGYFIHREIKYGLPKLRREWDRVEYAGEGMIRVSRKGRFGFVNARHEIVADPVWAALYDYHHGAARAYTAEGGVTYLDTQGRKLIPVLKAHDATDMQQDGVATIHVERFVAPTRTVVSTTATIQAVVITAEEAAVMESRITERHIDPDSKGIAIHRDYCALLRADGACIHMYNVTRIRAWRAGYAPVRVKTGRWGVIDTKGNIVVPAQWRSVTIHAADDVEVTDIDGHTFTCNPQTQQLTPRTK